MRGRIRKIFPWLPEKLDIDAKKIYADVLIEKEEEIMTKLRGAGLKDVPKEIESGLKEYKSALMAYVKHVFSSKKAIEALQDKLVVTEANLDIKIDKALRKHEEQKKAGQVFLHGKERG
ncbi:MAG: hypothetical protein DDT19_01802 [Syntrophomonadaceae bacterium]|nr:hypothetical protein [Bacillota bacterium]